MPIYTHVLKACSYFPDLLSNLTNNVNVSVLQHLILIYYTFGQCQGVLNNTGITVLLAKEVTLF